MTKFIFTGQLQARSLLLKVGEGADLETPKNLDMPKKRGGERGPPAPPPTQCFMPGLPGEIPYIPSYI